MGQESMQPEGLGCPAEEEIAEAGNRVLRASMTGSHAELILAHVDLARAPS